MLNAPSGPFRQTGPVAVVVWLLCLAIGAAPSSVAEAPRDITVFSDGSTEVSDYFPAFHTVTANITVPRNSHIVSAKFDVKAIPGPSGEYPSDPGISVGQSQSPVWSFGPYRTGAGELGRQTRFSDGSPESVVPVPGGGKRVLEPRILIPSGAKVRSATVLMEGQEDYTGVRETIAPEDNGSLLVSRSGAAQVIRVSSVAATLDIELIEAANGSNVSFFRFPVENLSPPRDVAYCAFADTLGVLLPGSGLLAINLSNGKSSTYLTGPEAFSLTAISSAGKNHLVAAGNQGAYAIDVASGALTVYPAKMNLSAFRGSVRAVTYDEDNGRFFVAWQDYYNGGGISVLHPASGQSEIYYEQDLSGDCNSLVYLPETGDLLLGLGLDYFRGDPVACPVRKLELPGGSFTDVPAFTGLSGIGPMQSDGARLAALGWAEGTSTLIDYNLTDGTWKSQAIEFPFELPVRSWAYDFSSGCLYTSTSGRGLWKFDSTGARGGPMRAGDPLNGILTTFCLDGRRGLVGTASGVYSIEEGKLPQRVLDCGYVTVLENGRSEGTFIAGDAQDWHYDPVLQRWHFGRLGVHFVNITGGPASDYTMELGNLSYDCYITAIVPGHRNGTYFVAVSGAPSPPGLFEIDLDTKTAVSVPALTNAVTALALSPDQNTLYAGCDGRGGGVLEISLLNGTRRTYNTSSEPALMSPSVTSVSVDDTGALTVGHSSYCPGVGWCVGGATVLVPGTNSSEFYYRITTSYSGGYDVLDAARDPDAGKLFLGLGGTGGLVTVDEKTGAEHQMDGAGRFGRRLGLVVDLRYYHSVRTLTGTAYDRTRSTLAVFSIRWNGSQPTDVAMDVGADGEYDFSVPGPLDRVVNADISRQLESALLASQTGEDFVEIPLALKSSTGGQVRLSSLCVIYDLSVRLDVEEQLSECLALLPPGSGAVQLPVRFWAWKGGLTLYDLRVLYEENSPARQIRKTSLRADAGASSPLIADMAPRFLDDHDSAFNLTYSINNAAQLRAVRISVWAGHYLLVDARGSNFRGELTVKISVRDSGGLVANITVPVTISREGEYVSPPPIYYTGLGVFVAVLAAAGVYACYLWRRIRRRGDT